MPVLLVFLALAIPSPVLSVYFPVEDNSTTTIASYILATSTVNHINGKRLLATLNCESGLDYLAVGDNGHSFGVAQIFLPAHKDITKEQALDWRWSIDWSVMQWKKGNQRIWTCYALTAVARD